jgi:hypothetical protein
MSTTSGFFDMFVGGLKGGGGEEEEEEEEGREGRRRFQ